MSRQLINQYYNNLDRAIQFGKSKNEEAIKSHFWNLLNDYARKNNYEIVREVFCLGTRGTKVRPDGTLKNLFGLDVGYWESKDEKDSIDDEIDTKIKKGYPLTNTLFEDSGIAILFQRGEEVMRINMREADSLHKILNEFVAFKSESVHIFEDALEKFKADIPTIVEALRSKIDETGSQNKNYLAASESFLALCKEEINPEITIADIREMMIQHILTSDIFNKVFDDPEFHKHNNIASELEQLISILFTYSERRNLLASIEHYYDAINAAAAGIVDHHEKQKFLKVLYENFYKVYNPKAADRLGVVYTPNEIVQFMIEGTDYLLGRYFDRTLSDKNVEILDPATGTGTFISSIIDIIPKQSLQYKYREEIHANEVSILPYYIANLNIEFTFKQRMGFYDEFKNLCFVDTLDNIGALKGVRRDQGRQTDIFGLSSENAARIKKQNEKKISIIIGNPPYNANQANENENNKNREYPAIDGHIKSTFIKFSTAQKTKVYDMYARFYRWAMDRVDNNGIIAYITNRSFIESRTFDGFRKCIQQDFAHAYIIDTKSDVRSNSKIAGTTHNVFGIQTGVAIMFLIRHENQVGGCKINYVSLQDDWRKEIKLDWLRNNKLRDISFESILPDKNNNWLKLSNNDFDSLLPIASKDVKLGRKNEAVFKLFSLGVVTNRDEWVHDEDEVNLQKKVKFLIDAYNQDRLKLKGKTKLEIKNEVSYSIKWTRAVLNDLFKNKEYKYDRTLTFDTLYRPYVKRKLYYSKELNEMRYQMPQIIPEKNSENRIIGFLQGERQQFSCFATDVIPNLAMFSADYAQCLPYYSYDENGRQNENITDWGLEQFVNHYGDKHIRKDDIFHYTYAVLHDPGYKQSYELNLKREFPRLPFYSDFRKYVEWGKKLMDLHIGYEKVEPFNLETVASETKAEHKRVSKRLFESAEPEALYSRKPKIKAKLKAHRDKGIIEIDELTILKGVPADAWTYKLGNRSALEWILDQYKEKKPSDPTILEKFNTYKFADYRDEVITLLKRVCTVSIETMKIVGEMQGEKIK